MSQKKAWFLKHALQGMNYVLSYLKVFIAYIFLKPIESKSVFRKQENME